MTTEEFNRMIWRIGMKVRCYSQDCHYAPFVANVMAVDFDQKLIAVAVDTTHTKDMWQWFRCESCLIENDTKEQQQWHTKN